MNTGRTLRKLGGVGRLVGQAAERAREDHAFRKAVRRMPKSVPWEWAAPRLIPVIAGPVFDPPGEPLVRVRSELGPMVEIGLDLGVALTFVDARVAERWECSPVQLMDRALRNLGGRAARIDTLRVQTGVMSGREIRVLRDRPRWAASLLLVPDELFRLFGRHDQVLAAPAADCLVSFPIDAPAITIADIVVDFEQASWRPLFLDPFLIVDGELQWPEIGDSDDDIDEWTA